MCSKPVHASVVFCRVVDDHRRFNLRTISILLFLLQRRSIDILSVIYLLRHMLDITSYFSVLAVIVQLTNMVFKHTIGVYTGGVGDAIRRPDGV